MPTPVPLPAAGELPPGLFARPVALEDVARVHELIAAHDMQYLPRPDSSPDDVRSDLEHRNVDRERSTWLVEDVDDVAVGYGLAYTDVDNGEFFFGPSVRPGADPRLWLWLLGRSLALAEEVRRDLGKDLVVASEAFAQDLEWSSQLGGCGLGLVRRYWRMNVDFDPAASPVRPSLGGDVRIRLVDVDEAELRRLHGVVDESFAEHFGSHRRDFGTWWTDVQNWSGYDPSQWWLCLVDGEPAGALMGASRQEGEGIGYVRVLGVLRAYRGRGLAKSLLRTAFASYAARGLTGAELWVDAYNPTGATRLYESVGMSTQVVVEGWRGTLTADGIVRLEPEESVTSAVSA